LYNDESRGGKLFADYQPVSWDILRFSYHLARDIHKEKNDEYLPFSKSYSYTGSIGMENEFTRIKNLALVAGVSYDWFDIKGSNYNTTNKVGDFTGQFDNKTAPIQHSFNPMGGLTYQIDKDTKLFTSVAKKTRFPTLQELYSSKGGNPDLQAEQSVNTTFGINHAFGNLAWAELAYFYHDISDWITRDLPTEQGGNYLNFGEIRMAGFELNTEFYPPWVKDLVLSFDYMYNRAKDHSEGRVTDKVLNTPLHKFDVGLQYTVPCIGTRLDFNAIYVAQTYSRLPTPKYPNDPTIKSDSQMTFDCRISQNFMKYFEAYMAMQNMLDRDYEPEYGFPAMGRTVWFGLTAKY
jgi:outer membrane cobalamin receptor